VGTTSRYTLTPAQTETNFAERCAENRRRFDTGAYGHVRRGKIHRMVLTEIADGLYSIYLPACHASSFSPDPTQWLATDQAPNCDNYCDKCRAASPEGRHAPRVVRPTGGWRHVAQLALALPCDGNSPTGLYEL
jgi:hypothetical protein